MRAKLAFIAIGGNSLIKSKDRQTVEDQHQAIRETMRQWSEMRSRNPRRSQPPWIRSRSKR